MFSHIFLIIWHSSKIIFHELYLFRHTKLRLLKWGLIASSSLHKFPRNHPKFSETDSNKKRKESKQNLTMAQMWISVISTIFNRNPCPVLHRADLSNLLMISIEAKAIECLETSKSWIDLTWVGGMREF